MTERPSIHELYKKIRESKQYINNGHIYIINSSAIASDALKLGYDVSCLQEVLLQVFDEFIPSDYAGKRPPESAYERVITGSDLFPFSWMSAKFGCRVYLKFTLKKNKFYLVSFHEDRK